MDEKNPKIQDRDFQPNQPGKRLYFFPRAKTTGTSEEAIKLRKRRQTPKVEQVEKTKIAKQGKKKPAKSN